MSKGEETMIKKALKILGSLSGKTRGILAALVAVSLLLIPVFYVELTERNIYATVASPAERLGPGDYSVGIDHEDLKVLKVEDTWYPIFRTSGDAKSLVMTQCYDFTIYGFRFGWLSLIPKSFAWEKVDAANCS